MTTFDTHNVKAAKWHIAFVAMIVALAMVVPCAQAQAEVRKSDVIAGLTVDERSLTVAECPSVDAEHAVLVNKDGEILFSRDCDSPSQIASVTKVMTAIVAIENAREGTSVTVSEAAASIGESSANLQEGDVLDFESALKALLVPSGNDAALALAETVGAQMIEADSSLGTDPVHVFVDAMNKKAAQLGCSDTVYENPHGLDDGEYAGNLHSTAADQAKVAKCAMENQQIRDIVSGGSTTIKVNRGNSKEDVELETTDELLEMYKYAIGIKTGVTNLAGPSFMGAASKDDRELYAVVLGSSDETQRFVDCENMFEWAYDHVIELKLANSSESTTIKGGVHAGDVPVVAEVAHGDFIDKTLKATFDDPEAAITVFDLEGNVSQKFEFDDVHGTVRVGDKLGTVKFYQHNELVATQDLIACESLEAPNPIDSFGIWWQRFFGGFSGAPEKADSVVLNVMPVISNNKTNAA